MTVKEFAEVRDSINNTVQGKPQKRKATSRPPAERDPQEAAAQKEHRVALALRTAGLRKVKAGIDKATNTMKNYEEKLDKLKEKGYPEEMNTFCASMILKLQPHTQEAQMAYNEEVVKVPGADAGALKE